MQPDQLRESTLDPASRTLRQITLEDTKDAAASFEILMGKNVGIRREFIDANALNADIDAL